MSEPTPQWAHSVAAQADADQQEAIIRACARLVACYYLTLRRQGVTRTAAVHLTLGWQQMGLDYARD